MSGVHLNPSHWTNECGDLGSISLYIPVAIW